MNKKSLILIYFLAILAVLIAVSVWVVGDIGSKSQNVNQLQDVNKNKVDTSEWKRYVNYDYGFSFKYPPGYSFRDKYGYVFICYNENNNCIKGDFTIKYIASYEKYDNLRDYVVEDRKNIEEYNSIKNSANAQNSFIGDIEEKIIDGKKFYTFLTKDTTLYCLGGFAADQCVTSVNSYDGGTRFIYISSGNNIYKITINGDDKNYDEIVNSINFLAEDVSGWNVYRDGNNRFEITYPKIFNSVNGNLERIDFSTNDIIKNNSYFDFGILNNNEDLSLSDWVRGGEFENLAKTLNINYSSLNNFDESIKIFNKDGYGVSTYFGENINGNSFGLSLLPIENKVVILYYLFQSVDDEKNFYNIVINFNFLDNENRINGIDISNWKTYNNKKFGYSIKYPGNWGVQEYIDDGISFDKNFNNLNKGIDTYDIAVKIFSAEYYSHPEYTLDKLIMSVGWPEIEYMYNFTKFYTASGMSGYDVIMGVMGLGSPKIGFSEKVFFNISKNSYAYANKKGIEFVKMSYNNDEYTNRIFNAIKKTFKYIDDKNENNNQSKEDMDISGWQKYEDEQSGISFMYPSDWSLLYDKTGVPHYNMNVEAFCTGFINNCERGTFDINRLRGDIDFKSISLKSISEGYQKMVKKGKSFDNQSTGRFISDLENITVGGREAYKFSVEKGVATCGWFENVDQCENAWWWVRDESDIVIIEGRNNEKFEIILSKDNNIANKILETVQFLPQIGLEPVGWLKRQ